MNVLDGRKIHMQKEQVLEVTDRKSSDVVSFNYDVAGLSSLPADVFIFCLLR